MTYKNKFYFLIIVIGVLVLLYAGSVISDSGIFSGHSSFVWIDSKTAEKAGRIAMVVQFDEEEPGEFELFKQDDKWFVLFNERKFPARQIRVKDFLSLLSARAAWQVRSTTASSHERFGLSDKSSRITIYGDNSLGADTVLLDLLLGNDDEIKNETYFRKADQNEVRSGDRSIKTYLTSPISNWYNFKLIPESDAGQVNLADVQKVTVITPSETQIFSKKNRSWTVAGIQLTNPDVPAIENYLRVILNADGDSFDENISRDDRDFEHSRIVIEMGNAKIITISLTEADETGRRLAKVSGSSYEGYIYSIPQWSAERLFREGSSFEFQQ